MQAIALQPGCLVCLVRLNSGNFKARLSADYPLDKSCGYSMGQIRRAVSVKCSL